MVLGTNTRRFLASKKGPGFAVMEELKQYEQFAKTLVGAAVTKALASAREELAGKLAAVQQTFDTGAEAIMANLPGMEARLEQILTAEFTRRLDVIKGPKGDAGHTPTPDELRGLIQPLIHLPTTEDFLALIVPLIPPAAKDGATPTDDHLRALMGPIAEQLVEHFDPTAQAAAIARAIEALPLQERLDYERGLKNKPGVPVADTRLHTMHRGGGGSSVYEYDLSSLCDGGTKSFTVPANTRIVHAECSDAPSGILKKTTDWTGSGTTTFALTSAVATPSAGATLSILYVI